MIANLLSGLGIEHAACGPSADAWVRRSALPALACDRDEYCVAMAHGYAKVAGQPMAALLAGDRGVKGAAMAIYNAFCDRVPLLVFVARETPDDTRSIREFVKYDGRANSPEDLRRATALAYRAALTPPMGPAVVTFDGDMQEVAALGDIAPPYAPQASADAIERAAGVLMSAERPLICAERAVRTQRGMQLLVELAELLGSPVINGEWLNFPNDHPLAGAGGEGYRPDAVLALDVADADALALRFRPARCIQIASLLLAAGRNYQTDNGYRGRTHLDIAGDAEATLPVLIDACRGRTTPAFAQAAAERLRGAEQAHRTERAAHLKTARIGWDASPVSVARLCAELWPLIQDEDWSLVSWTGFLSGWPLRLWNFDRRYRYIGGSGAGGLGYGAPAAAGVALANQRFGRLSINIQSDGDLMYGPSILATVARHRIPLLTIMHNNRAYHAEVDVLRRHAQRLHRDSEHTRIGTTLDRPAIDFANLARSMGLYAEGPISDAGELRAAFLRGIARVKAGETVLIDVLTQPR